MRRERAVKGARRGQPAQQQRIWRVFEYRRPVPVRRIRFTT
ncbi:MAG TPA: hypothetical protein VLD13_02255 [Gaiellaceae bacterium]|nr:hypothetical protein [Gaiellaceae bacterium]